MKVSVAYISKPRGFKGELAVIPYKENTDSIAQGSKVTLLKGDESHEFIIETVKSLNGRMAIKFEGIDNEVTALAWRGAEVLVDKKDLSALGENEFYHFDIEGLDVFEESGEYLGKVTAIEFLSANNVLTVTGENREILIPFVKSIVINVDIKSRKMIIRKIDGLY